MLLFLSLSWNFNLYHSDGVIKRSIWSWSVLRHKAYWEYAFAPFTSFYRQVVYLISTTRLDDTVGNHLGVRWWLFNCSAMHHYMRSNKRVPLCPLCKHSTPLHSGLHYIVNVTGLLCCMIRCRATSPSFTVFSSESVNQTVVSVVDILCSPVLAKM